MLNQIVKTVAYHVKNGSAEEYEPSNKTKKAIWSQKIQNLLPKTWMKIASLIYPHIITA